MPPASHISNLATCLCRQFRRPSRNPRILPAYTRCFNASAPRRSGGGEGRSNEIGLEPLSELLILRPLGPPKPRHEGMRFAQNPLEANDLDNAQKQLLEYETMGSQNIDIALVRPASVLVSKERYIQLAEQLSKAFLKAQLFEYYHTQDAEGKTPLKLLSIANKGEIINAILSVRWGITVSSDIPERLDVLVNKDLRRTRREVFFILGKEGRTIRQLSQDFQARLKVNIESGNINVNASLENFERLQEAIEILLRGINEKEFDISWAQRLCQFNEQFIPPIARITGTYIEKKDEKTLLISALDPSSLQDARRLLFMSFDLQLRSSYSLLYNAPKKSEDPERSEEPKGALYPVCEKLALPWNFREAEWGRWRDIKTHIEHSASIRGKGSTILKDTLRRRAGGVVHDTDDITTELRKMLDHSELRVPAQHQSELLTEYEAIFGYLLHENSDPQPDRYLTAREFVESKDRPQVLLTDIPGLVHIARALSPMGGPTSGKAFRTSQAQTSADERRTPGQTCIVKLLPSPLGYPEGFDRYPPLELRFNIDPKSGGVGQPALRAIHSSTIADAMFPSEECDVRFRRQESISLGILDGCASPGFEYGITRSELIRYLSDSRLNPLVDGELRTSQLLSVKLPEWMISPPKRHESEDGEEKPSPPTTMEYISTSLEYRHEVAFDWNGMELYRTVVQGGITGGKRSEFRLRWSDREGADSLAEAPRITNSEDGDEAVDKVVEVSTDGIAAETAPETITETVAMSDTDASDGIPGEPILGADLGDVGESRDKITEPTTDQSLQHTPQSLYCHSSPNLRFSFVDFLTNTTDLVGQLGGFLASKKWRFATSSMEHRAARPGTTGAEWSSRSGKGSRGSRGGRGGRGSWGSWNDRYSGAAGGSWEKWYNG